MTAPWKREAAKKGRDAVVLCDFYEGFEKEGTTMSLSGIYSLEDLKAFGMPVLFINNNLQRKQIWNVPLLLGPACSNYC